MPSRPMWCAVSALASGESANRKSGAFVYPLNPAAIAKDTALTDQQRQIIARIKTLAESITTGINPRLRKIRNAQARQRSSFTISHEFTYVISWRCSAQSIIFAREEWARERDSDADQRGRASIGENLRRAERQNMRRLAVPEGVLPEEMSSEGDDSQTPICDRITRLLKPCEPR